MPITKSAKKALKQNRKKRVFNVKRISKMRSLIKESKILINDKKKKKRLKFCLKFIRRLIKLLNAGLLKKIQLAEKKSRLVKAIESIDTGK